MLDVLRSDWALFLGIMLAAICGGLLATLMGVRGTAEGFSPFSISLTYAGFYLGYTSGALFVPKLITKVERVRVFAALASTASVIFLLYAIVPNIPAWIILRTLSGFCYAGCLFLVAGKLNTTATIKTSNQLILFYIIALVMGISLGQVIMNLASTEGFDLFIIGSVILSLSLIPMMLSIGTESNRDANKNERLIDVTPMGAFAAFVSGKTSATIKPMGIKELLRIVPLGAAGMFLHGGLMTTALTMTAIFGMIKGLPISSIGIFIATIFIGGAVTQYPIGWLALRMDKRWLIVIIASLGAGVFGFGTLIGNDIILLSIVAFVFGGILNSMYLLYMTYIKDILGEARLAEVTGMLFYCNTAGAIAGALVVGAFMTLYGADAYFIYIASLMGLIAVFTLYHIIRGAGVPVKET